MRRATVSQAFSVVVRLDPTFQYIVVLFHDLGCAAVDGLDFVRGFVYEHRLVRLRKRSAQNSGRALAVPWRRTETRKHSKGAIP